jgi:ABC-type multidrug transport system ATPase subunit
MELLFIHTESSSIISNLNLNFGNEFRFHYNATDKLVLVSKYDAYVPGFFGKNISNLTGVIGINGSGKTSILRYLIEFCTDGINNHYDEKSIIIYKKDGKLYYCCSSVITFTGVDTDSIRRVEAMDGFKSVTNAIYISNQFDPSSYYDNDYTRSQLGRTKNLSTWYLLHSDIQSKNGTDANNRSISFDHKMEAFASMEFGRIVRALRWINNRPERNPFPVKLPDFINLKLDLVYPLKDDGLGDLRLQVKAHFSETRKGKDLFLVKLFEAILYHSILEGNFAMGSEIAIQQYSQAADNISKVLINRSKGAVHKLDSVIDEINDIIDYLINSPSMTALAHRMIPTKDFINKVSQFYNSKYCKVSENGIVLGISIKNLNLSQLQDLIDHYYDTERIGNYASFYLSHNIFYSSTLSSGEYSLLSFFARLNSVRIGKSNILLLIDEAEMALHPQWQKQFISLLTDFIAERFKSNKVQIILTSHSPFILSDLPPNYVILLKRDGEKAKVVDSLDNKNETFGANIHELLTDSFFLQDGLIGEFARKKIDDLIKGVNRQETFTEKEYNALKKEIDMIGEPFVRYKLLEKIMMGLPKDAYDNVVIEREKELALIKKLRK